MNEISGQSRRGAPSLLLALAFVILSASAQVIKPQSANTNSGGVVRLELNAPIEREIAAGDKQVYAIDLQPRQRIKVKVTQPRIKVGVNFQPPDGRVVQMFEPFETRVEISFDWVAEMPGTHQIIIYGAAKGPAANYQIILLELREATEDETALQQARDLFHLYAQLNRNGRRDEARAQLIRCLEIREKILGQNDPLVGRTLAFLAAAYTAAGDYVAAEPLLIRAIEILEKAVGPNSPEVAVEIGALSQVYEEKGDDLKAEDAKRKALAIYEHENLMNSSGAASLLAGLAGIYYQRDDYDNAEKYYELSREVWEKLLGPDHFHLAPTYSHLGHVAYDAANYGKAESMFTRALSLAEKGLGADSVNLTPYRNDLAMLFCTTGSYVKGAELYQRALASHQEHAAMGAPGLQETLFGLARCAAAQSHTVEAVSFLSQANELQEHYLGINLAIGSEREKLTFLNTLKPRLSLIVSMHIDFAKDNAQARDLAALAILQQRGRVQDSVSASFAELRRRSNPADQKLLDQLNETTAELARVVLGLQQQVSPKERIAKIRTLEEEKEKLEEQVSLRSEGYYRALPVTLNAVKAAIPDDAALVEFIAYSPVNPTAPANIKTSGASRYAAYVISEHDEIRSADLGPVADLDNAINNWRQALRNPLRKDAQQLARAVDDKVMRPIRAAIGHATHLLISPDGELNLIPFGALIDEHGKYLIQGYSITYLTSGRELLRMQIVRESKSNMLIVAAPDFGEARTETLAAPNGSEKSRRRTGPGRSVTSGFSLNDTYFAPLEGTELEARSIQKSFPDAIARTGVQATEDVVKQANAPRILHLATHGFFLSAEPAPKRGSNATAQSSSNHVTETLQSPLLRSGLAFAGANQRGGKANDGILTALEASGLNLWGTKLVVLSACDTGVGEVRNEEGVYGLRRAFVLAGAESLVMSLWPISDYTTRQLMTAYYQNLKQSMGRGEALRRVQLDMLKKNPYLHPFYWANFIQAGEWANLDGRR